MLIILSSCEYENAEIKSGVQPVKYSIDIAPVISGKCSIAGCHIQGNAPGNLSVYSELKARIDNGKFQMFVFDLRLMPPALSTSLSAEEINTFKKWIEQGARDN